MKYQAFVRAAAGALAAAALTGAAIAQTQTTPVTMTDTAPAPASDRSSVGAVILMDQPVLAQRDAMQAAQERSAVDTRAMGAGPARVLRDVQVEQGKATEPAPLKK
jgi:methenyltetrahydromethanopterin cyclohydrolase